MLRALLEKISRNVILKRKLPDSFGGLTLFVSPGSALTYWKYNLNKTDTNLLNVAKDVIKRGDIVWDIGANVGLFSFAALYLTGKAGRVLSIEADSFLVGLLHRSAEINCFKITQPDILSMAISDYVGTGQLNLAKRGRASNFLSNASGSTQSGGVYKSEKVMVVTLDWLLSQYPAPNVVKIDIEGGELKALQGATRLLNNIRPKLICEVYSESVDALTEILEKNNYIIYDADTPLLARKPLERAVFNTLACPRQ